jgi:hypothetical protein
MIETGNNCLNNESNFFKKHSCDDTKVMMIIWSLSFQLDFIEASTFVSLLGNYTSNILFGSSHIILIALLHYTMVFFHFTDSLVLNR